MYKQTFRLYYKLFQGYCVNCEKKLKMEWPIFFGVISLCQIRKKNSKCTMRILLKDLWDRQILIKNKAKVSWISIKKHMKLKLQNFIETGSLHITCNNKNFNLIHFVLRWVYTCIDLLHASFYWRQSMPLFYNKGIYYKNILGSWF